MGQFCTAFAASLLACGMTTAGLHVIRRHDAWARLNATYFACFAAGVLITVSFMHIAPRSFRMHPQAPTCLFAGYLAMHALNRFVTAHVCDKPATADYALGLVPLVGIGFHSLLDGAVYSISFTVDALTGGLVALGMVLHEFPEGIVTYALLLRGGFSGRQAFRLAFVAAAVTTPVGTALSYPFVSRIQEPLLGALLATSAGALIYVGATHLLPQAEREPRRFSIVALAAGVAVATGILMTASCR
jgi:zinc and cadmium transporter